MGWGAGGWKQGKTHLCAAACAAAAGPVRQLDAAAAHAGRCGGVDVVGWVREARVGWSSGYKAKRRRAAARCSSSSSSTLMQPKAPNPPSHPSHRHLRHTLEDSPCPLRPSRRCALFFFSIATPCVVPPPLACSSSSSS